jgi:hypothetical protein
MKGKTIQQIRENKLSKEIEAIIIKTRESIQRKIEEEFLSRKITYDKINFMGIDNIIHG